MVDRAGLGNPSLPRAKWSTAKVAIVGVKGWLNTSQDGCEENPTWEKYNNNLRFKYCWTNSGYFGCVAVVALSAAWVEKYKAEVEACISRIDQVNYVNWRPASEVMENGIFYSISLEGQKTGFNADQHGNREFISTISDGQKVLDMFCYSGSFALNAAQGGAANVIGVDSSLPAIELAKENVLNNMDPGRITFLKEDASEFMKGALSRNESWDIVILDPPKLVPRKKGAASAARRKITVLRDAIAARNHPIDPSYPEGKYLSNVLPRVL
ncbi:hypothetical protein C1H46_023543 [Malus baccata]|uniref:S-adenosylmethionine-dependent methyltransferase domain-containing protein n=1 Tax=Malus baccata TaxID=106549 RepID=A0A540LWQ7_MALBA|nr:hypothetical protein C1H46_023543 [Malus baccata]